MADDAAGGSPEVLALATSAHAPADEVPAGEERDEGDRRAGERAAMAAIAAVARLRDLWPPFAFGLAPLVLRAVRCLPRRLRYAVPVLPVLEAGFAER